MPTNGFCIEYAKRGTAGCKKCKQKIEKGILRIAKVVPNPFTDSGGDMKQWFHVNCVFETFVRARATTKKIEDPSDLDGWEEVKEEDRGVILQHMAEILNKAASKKTTPAKAKPSTSDKTATAMQSPSKPTPSVKQWTTGSNSTSSVGHRDNSFREFRRLCAKIAEESSYLTKTKIVSEFFKTGTEGDRFQGDLYLFVKLLLPGFVKRVYNLQSKQLLNHFSQIFGTSIDDMLEHLEKGDVADTVQIFFEKSTKCPPASKSTLCIQDVDNFLDELTSVTKDDDQIRTLENMAVRCTANDLKVVIRLIKKDLRINSGAKHILEGVHADAYQAFQASRNLEDVIHRILERKDAAANGKPEMAKSLSIRASLMTPIIPMLAEACKSVEHAMKKCPNGMYAEIKYDGERVQVHKQGDNFSYFSRSLKPVLPHKVGHFKDFIPQAFPHGQDLILDSEVLLIDTLTGTPLPFGTLGKHKKDAFKDATVCLFVFDCIHLNGENLLDKPLKERRRILQANMSEVPNHVKFSEMKHITQPDDLKDMIMEVLRKGLEGLVLKDCMGFYEPGKRHWLKVKKDYLAEGVMADSADLVVLGAFYGTGNKGGMMSIFLMGCHDPSTNKWCTVTKVSGGHDDKTLESLQTQLKMVKISKEMSKVPSWLKVTKNMVPDLICEDPKKSQVWEIVGAEFSKAEIHTADGISIRFPRVTRIRQDKTWKEATTLPELKVLFEKSKDHENLPDLLGRSGKVDDSSPNSKNARPSEIPNSTPKKGKDGSALSKVNRSIMHACQTPEKTDDNSNRASTSARKRKTSDDTRDPLGVKKLKFGCTSKEETVASSCILPDVFKGMRIFLSKSAKDYDLLHRYIVAYDGDVIDEVNIKTASHIVLNFMDNLPSGISKSAKLINQQWLLDSIMLQNVQNPMKYKWENPLG